MDPRQRNKQFTPYNYMNINTQQPSSLAATSLSMTKWASPNNLSSTISASNSDANLLEKFKPNSYLSPNTNELKVSILYPTNTIMKPRTDSSIPPYSWQPYGSLSVLERESEIKQMTARQSVGWSYSNNLSSTIRASENKINLLGDLKYNPSLSPTMDDVKASTLYSISTVTKPRTNFSFPSYYWQQTWSLPSLGRENEINQMMERPSREWLYPNNLSSTIRTPESNINLLLGNLKYDSPLLSNIDDLKTSPLYPTSTIMKQRVNPSSYSWQQYWLALNKKDSKDYLWQQHWPILDKKNESISPWQQQYWPALNKKNSTDHLLQQHWSILDKKSESISPWQQQYWLALNKKSSTDYLWQQHWPILDKKSESIPPWQQQYWPTFNKKSSADYLWQQHWPILDKKSESTPSWQQQYWPALNKKSSTDYLWQQHWPILDKKSESIPPWQQQYWPALNKKNSTDYLWQQHGPMLGKKSDLIPPWQQYWLVINYKKIEAEQMRLLAKSFFSPSSIHFTQEDSLLDYADIRGYPSTVEIEMLEESSENDSNSSTIVINSSESTSTDVGESSTIKEVSKEASKGLPKNDNKINIITSRKIPIIRLLPDDSEYFLEPDIDTEFYLAVRKGEVGIVKFLIEKGGNINLRDNDGNTPLHVSLEENYQYISKILIEQKADVTIQGEEGNTPLHVAIKKGQTDIVNMLIENKADVNVKNKDSDTALHIAVKKNNSIEGVRLLVEQKAKLSIENEDGYTPLHIAIQKDRMDLVEFFIQRNATISVNDVSEQYKEEIIYLLSRKKIMDSKYDEKIDISNLSLGYCSIGILSRLLLLIKETASISSICLSLKGNQLNDMHCEAFSNPLSLSTQIKELDLSHNQISYTGARRLADALPGNTSLKKIDLTGNRITCMAKLFKKFEKKFTEEKSALEEVQLGQNFLDRECEELFSCTGKRESRSTEPGPWYQYGIFKTRSRPIVSILDEKENITVEKWVVALACKKGTEHAMIFMEGMEKWGQRFFKCYHIRARNIIGLAKTFIEDVDLKSYRSDDYYITAKPISRTDGDILRDLVELDEQKPISFSMISPSLSQDKVNCLVWCLKKLEKIDIHIEPSLLGLPSTTAAQRRSICLIQ